MSEQSIFVPTRMPRVGFIALARGIEFLFFIFSHLEISGRENLPPDNFLFTLNHLSVFDIGLGYVVLRGDRMSRTVAFAGDTWRKNLLTRLALQLMNVIWVNRGETSPSTIKASLRVLREGYILGFAPEGTRSKESHALIKGRTGAAFLALKADVPIVPVAMSNVENLSAAMKRWKRIEIKVRVGKPYKLEPPPTGVRVDQDYLEKSTDEIMCRIAALLPPEYRGEYAEHPRLKELLEKENAHSSE